MPSWMGVLRPTGRCSARKARWTSCPQWRPNTSRPRPRSPPVPRSPQGRLRQAPRGSTPAPCNQVPTSPWPQRAVSRPCCIQTVTLIGALPFLSFCLFPGLSPVFCPDLSSEFHRISLSEPLAQRMLGEGGSSGGGVATGQWCLVSRAGPKTPPDPTGERIGSLRSQHSAPRSE